MQEEIEYRKLVVRKEALEDVKKRGPRATFRRISNIMLQKKFKNKNEGRIRFLERMIKTAEVVSDESAADEVGMNNKVEVWFEEDDETETYKIVTTMRQDSLKGLISGESPLGKALLGHKVGDRVFVEIGGGDGYYVVIRSIDKSAGDDDELRSFLRRNLMKIMVTGAGGFVGSRLVAYYGKKIRRVGRNPQRPGSDG